MSRGPTGRRGPRWVNTSSLRFRILVIFIGLFALLFAAVGATTVVMLNQFQLKQLDAQLSAANQRFQKRPPSELPPNVRPPWEFGQHQTDPALPDLDHEPPSDLERLSYSKQSVNTISARIDATGKITAAIERDDRMEEISATKREVFAVLANLPANGRPQTRDLGTFGTYRLVANQHRIRTTGETEILVNGLPMDTLQESLFWLVGFELSAGLAALLLASLSGAAVIRIALAPLERVAATARRVSRMPLHEGEVGPLDRVPSADTDPHSEIGQVGAAFNRLLDHVGSALAIRQASETQLRQFVADASHELRTPLAAIRGYTELTRRHRSTTPPPVADSLDRVEAAAQRMTTLVEDLLLLARLDARRPLAREPVDLSAMVVEALTDAHVAGPDHRWLLDLPDDQVTITGDGARLHQVLANLLANAKTHTPPGTAVTVSLAAAPDGVALRVMDNGPGIPPHLLPRLFERFARGDTSRSRATGSTGLGLAIVNAVVCAHGGTVDVSSQPGCTVFVVWLPSPDDAPSTSQKNAHGSQPAHM